MSTSDRLSAHAKVSTIFGNRLSLRRQQHSLTNSNNVTQNSHSCRCTLHDAALASATLLAA